MDNTPVYPTYIKAILALSPNAEIAGIGENLDSLVWVKNPDNITNEQIETKLAELQADYNSKKYQRDRVISYPSIQEQLDMLYWDRKNGTKTWEESIDKVKADNRKPE